MKNATIGHFRNWSYQKFMSYIWFRYSEMQIKTLWELYFRYFNSCSRHFQNYLGCKCVIHINGNKAITFLRYYILYLISDVTVFWIQVKKKEKKERSLFFGKVKIYIETIMLLIYRRSCFLNGFRYTYLCILFSTN